MPATTSPATVVICAVDGHSPGHVRHPATAVVTRVLDLESLLRGGRAGDDVALAIDPAWLTSRQSLRQALVRARHAAPGLEAAVLRNAPLTHHAVLAEEGIRVVLVDEFAAVGRGSRRPAPTGWPCRNVAWGLWEVRACPPRRGRGWGWLPSLPAPRAAALHACVDAGGRAGDATLRRLIDWTQRGVARGRIASVTLAGLATILEGRRAAPLVASVLKAA